MWITLQLYSKNSEARFDLFWKAETFNLHQLSYIKKKKILFYSCDADPSALAKYVVALVKKDKPEKELKALCVDQLDVFLQKGKIYILFPDCYLIHFI